MRYSNITPSHREIIQKCTSERLWINDDGIIYNPWDAIRKFGVTHMVHSQYKTTVDPVSLIEQTILIIKRKIISGQPETEILSAFKRTEVFFASKVRQYYRNDMDGRLLKSIKTGIWQE